MDRGEFAETGENGADGFGVADVGGHGHEALDAQVGEFPNALEPLPHFAGSETVFGGFAGDVDFEQDGQDPAEFGAAAFEGLGEGQPVDGVDTVKEFNCLADFAALDVADHVPADAVAGRGDFFARGFDAVFAEVGDAETNQDADFVNAGGFGHGDEADAGGVASGARRGDGDAFADESQI
jgi:hypothetical protein